MVAVAVRPVQPHRESGRRSRTRAAQNDAGKKGQQRTDAKNRNGREDRRKQNGGLIQDRQKKRGFFFSGLERKERKKRGKKDRERVWMGGERGEGSGGGRAATAAKLPTTKN